MISSNYVILFDIFCQNQLTIVEYYTQRTDERSLLHHYNVRDESRRLKSLLRYYTNFIQLYYYGI